MRTKSRALPHFTPDQRSRILEACQSSGLTRRQSAARAGISVSTLQLWLRQASASPVSKTSPPFVAVPNLLATPGAPLPLRLCLPGGLHLEIPPGFQPEEVGSLLQILRAL